MASFPTMGLSGMEWYTASSVKHPMMKSVVPAFPRRDELADELVVGGAGVVSAHRVATLVRRGRPHSISARISRQRLASPASLVWKASMRASLSVSCLASDSFSSAASWSIAFCTARAFLVVSPLLAR